MIKDLVKFTAKIAIVAVIFVYVVAPHIPGLPKIGDLIHLPSWQSVAKFVLDPGDLLGKTDRFNQWANKLPDHVGPVPMVRPKDSF